MKCISLGRSVTSMGGAARTLAIVKRIYSRLELERKADCRTIRTSPDRCTPDLNSSKYSSTSVITKSTIYISKTSMPIVS